MSWRAPICDTPDVTSIDLAEAKTRAILEILQILRGQHPTYVCELLRQMKLHPPPPPDDDDPDHQRPGGPVLRMSRAAVAVLLIVLL